MADDDGGIAGEDGQGLLVAAGQAGPGGNGGVAGQLDAFGDNSMASNPDIVTHSDGAVGVYDVAVGIDEGMLVGIHEGAAPRDANGFAEGHPMVADEERFGAKMESVAHRKHSIL